MEASAALSELAFSLRSCKGRYITRADFETTLKRYLSGSHADQQISQLWDKVALHGLKVHQEIRCNVFPVQISGERATIGQGELCSFLLKEMQQKESQAKAHLTLPLPHQPSFSSMPNTKVSGLPLHNYCSYSYNVCIIITIFRLPNYKTFFQTV